MPDPLKNKDVRWRQRFQNFQKAFSQLSNAATLAQQRELTDLEQQGLIQAFEFTHELAWNTLKDFLESRGRSNIFGSKDATREGFAAGLIEDGDAWMQMIENRNETTHTYDEETADEIGEAVLSSYVPSLKSSRQDLHNWSAKRKHESRPDKRDSGSHSLSSGTFSPSGESSPLWFASKR